MEPVDPKYAQYLFGMQQEPDVWSPAGIQAAAAQMQPTSITIQQAKKTLIPEDTFNLIKQRQLDSFKNQAQGIQDFEGDIKKRESQIGINPILAAASGLSDMFAGTNRLQGLNQQKMMQEQKLEMDKAKLQGMRKDLTQEDINMLKEQYQHQSDADKWNAQMKMLDKKLAADKGNSLTPGQEAADKAYGKDYQEWNPQGGYAGVEKQLGALESAAQALKDNPGMTGPVVSAMPDVIRRRTNPEAFALQQQVEQAVQGSLRATLGAQFTEKEGERIMRNSFDPALPAEENIKKLNATIQELKTKALEKERSAKYFEQTGTLKGLGAAGNKVNSSPATSAPINDPGFEAWKKAKGHK